MTWDYTDVSYAIGIYYSLRGSAWLAVDDSGSVMGAGFHDGSVGYQAIATEIKSYRFNNYKVAANVERAGAAVVPDHRSLIVREDIDPLRAALDARDCGLRFGDEFTEFGQKLTLDLKAFDIDSPTMTAMIGAVYLATLGRDDWKAKEYQLPTSKMPKPRTAYKGRCRAKVVGGDNV